MEKSLGIMDIRCVGIPAVPEWAMQTVQDELRRGTSFDLRRIRPPGFEQGRIHPHCRSRNRIQCMGEYHQVDLVFDGSIERIADRLLIGWRMVVVHNPANEYFWVKDYTYDPDRLEEVIRSSLRQFLDQLQVTGPIALHQPPT